MLKFLTDDTADHLVPAPITRSAPGSTSSIAEEAERESGYNSLHFSEFRQNKPDLDPQYHHLHRPHHSHRF